jgi:hypothetical protein
MANPDRHGQIQEVAFYCREEIKLSPNIVTINYLLLQKKTASNPIILI